LRKIIEDYPLAPVANPARILLNLPVVEEESTDVGDSIYLQAENYFVSEKYDSALVGFLQIASSFPNSKHFTRSAYAAGWIYENALSIPDSALVYYEKILAADPNSAFARIVAPKIEEYKKREAPPEELKQEEGKEQIQEENKENTGEDLQKQKKNEEDIIKKDETTEPTIKDK